MSEPTIADRVSSAARRVFNTARAAATNNAAGDAHGIGSARRRNGISQRAARLSAFDPAGYVGYKFSRGANIYLPHLPPELSFERLSSFQAINTPLTPDGLIHLYQHTSPMEVVFDFGLHYQDEYCENGALDLVRVASFLHALVLPFTAKNAPPTQVSTATRASAEAALSDAARQTSSAASSGAAEVLEIATQKRNAAIADTPHIELAWPTPCLLEIFRAGNKAVVMHGYVKAAKALFKEPWLQTADESGYNLPSSATYSFTFVNAPTYRNLVTSAYKDAGKTIEEDRTRKIFASDFSDLNFGQGYNEQVRDGFYDFTKIANAQNTNPLGTKLLEKGSL